MPMLHKTLKKLLRQLAFDHCLHAIATQHHQEATAAASFSPLSGCCISFSVCCCFDAASFARLACTSLTAALMASSASMLQCSLTGGKLKCFAISLFLIVSTSSIDLPFTLRGNQTMCCACGFDTMRSLTPTMSMIQFAALTAAEHFAMHCPLAQAPCTLSARGNRQW